MNGNHPDEKCRRVTFIGGIASGASCWVKADTDQVIWAHPQADSFAFVGERDNIIEVDVYVRAGNPHEFWYVRTERR